MSKKRQAYVSVMGREFKHNLVAQSKMPLLAGLCDILNAVVSIAKGQTKLDRERSEIHEYTHAAINRMGLDQTISEENQEQICVMNENLFTETFKTRLNKYYKD